MSSGKDGESSNRSMNENYRNREVQTTTGSGWTFSIDRLERFASAAVGTTVRQSNAHAERIKWLKIYVRENTKSSQAADLLASTARYSISSL